MAIHFNNFPAVNKFFFKIDKKAFNFPFLKRIIIIPIRTSNSGSLNKKSLRTKMDFITIIIIVVVVGREEKRREEGFIYP